MIKEKEKKPAVLHADTEKATNAAPADRRYYTVEADANTGLYHIRRLRDYKLIDSFLNSDDAIDKCDECEAARKKLDTL